MGSLKQRHDVVWSQPFGKHPELQWLLELSDLQASMVSLPDMSLHTLQPDAASLDFQPQWPAGLSRGNPQSDGASSATTPPSKPASASGASDHGSPSRRQQSGGKKGGGHGGKPSATKKCNRCNVLKEPAAFQKGQAMCGECYNHVRNCRAFARRNGEGDWFDHLEVKHQGQVVKAYSKEAAMAKKEARRVKFNLKEFIEQFSASTGRRYEGHRVMMWFGAYQEWARSAAGGFLTDPEIDANWQAWTSSLKRFADKKGPRGAMRLPVKVQDVLIDYDDLAQTRALKQSGKVGKGVTDEQIQDRFDAWAMNNHEDALLDMSSLRDGMGSAAVQSSSLTDDAWTGAFGATDMHMLKKDGMGLMRKASGKMDASDDDNEETDDEAGQGTDPKNTWWDREQDLHGQ